MSFRILSIFMVFLALTGCKETEKKILESDVNLASPASVSAYMEQLSDKEKRKQYFSKVIGHKVSYSAKINPKSDFHRGEVSMGGGVKCEIPEGYKHHVLNTSHGKLFACLGKYVSYERYIGGAIGLTISYEPTPDTIAKFNVVPNHANFTAFDARQAAKEMTSLTKIQRENFWESSVKSRLSFVSGKVADVEPAGLLTSAQVTFLQMDQDTAVICGIPERYEYIIYNLKRGDDFLCGGLISENYVELLGGLFFKVIFDPTVGRQN